MRPAFNDRTLTGEHVNRPHPTLIAVLIAGALLLTGPPDVPAAALDNDAASHTVSPVLLARESRAARQTRDLLDRTFREYESEHYIVFSNARRKWTKVQLNRLESAFHEFQRYATSLNLDPTPIRHKLVCVLFEDRRRYAEFGRNHDRVFAQWNHGYYAPRSDRVVLFNGEAEPDADEFAANRTIATTIHEAIHQLHYHTDIQNKHVQYPLWSGEGIATSFETIETDQSFGPEREFGPRRDRFERLLRRDGLIPLEQLVQLDRMPDNRRETVFTVYNQSYALVSWLAANRPVEFRAYLLRMQHAEPGRAEPAFHLEIFIASFGAADRLEEQWLRDEIRRVGPEAVAAQLLGRMKVSVDTIKMSIAQKENEGDVHILEQKNGESGWLDDFDLSRAADRLQYVPGLSGPPPSAR